MKQIIWTIIVLILIVFGIWYFSARTPKGEFNTIVPNSEQNTVIPETENSTPATNQTAEKTPIETAFDKAKDVTIQGEKAKVVDGTLRPILKSVFDKTVDEQVVNGVKMIDEFGSMLTYSLISKVTEQERDTVMNALVSAGAKIIDGEDRIYTIQKGLGSSWVITFYLNNNQKSGLEITF
jgi:hypothetical protein